MESRPDPACILTATTLPSSSENDMDHACLTPAIPVGPSLKVLVVDDNQDAAELVATILQLLGYEVCTSHSGADALQLAPRFAPDVVFLDLGMPGMGGFEVAQRMRQLPCMHAACIAALTGWGDAATRLKTARAGFDVHLQKPAALDQLLAVCTLAASRSGATAFHPLS